MATGKTSLKMNFLISRGT